MICLVALKDFTMRITPQPVWFGSLVSIVLVLAGGHAACMLRAGDLDSSPLVSTNIFMRLQRYVA